jgi:hypothetical protein
MLLVSIMLIVVMTALVPAAVLAGDNGKHKPSSTPAVTDFSGSGLLYVTYMPAPATRGSIWLYNGEIAEGFLQQSDWTLLAGTAFWSSHDSVVRVQDDGTTRGIMRGNFTLTRPDGSGVLEGVFEGKISGNLYLGNISDSGMWRSTGGSGVFADVKAWGQWSAELVYDTGLGTLIGPLLWEGKYIEK